MGELFPKFQSKAALSRVSHVSAVGGGGVTTVVSIKCMIVGEGRSILRSHYVFEPGGICGEHTSLKTIKLIDRI